MQPTQPAQFTPFHAFLRALRLPAHEAADAAAALALLTTSLRLGALLPRFDAHAHCALLPPAHAPLLLVTLPGGSSFLLHAALLASKCSALQEAARAQPEGGGGAAGGSACAALAAAAARWRAVLPLPVRISAAAAAPSALAGDAELRAWLLRHARLLSDLVSTSSSGGGGAEAGGAWEVVARAGPHAALRLCEGPAADACCPVALAALLLDYPIAYDLGGSAAHCLGGCELHVWRAGGSIAFSLPAALAPSQAARSALAQWQELLAQRAAAAGVAPLALDVRSECRAHVVV